MPKLNKEQEILAKQRQLAMMMRVSGAPPTRSLDDAATPQQQHQQSSSAKSGPTPLPLRAATAESTASSKRPSSDTSAILAAARAAAGSGSPKPPPPAAPVASQTIRPLKRSKPGAITAAASTATAPLLQHPTPSLQRKSETSSSGAATKSTFGKLLNQVSSKDGAVVLADTLPSYEPDDFWRHLREWDFVTQYASVVRTKAVEGSALSAASSLIAPPKTRTRSLSQCSTLQGRLGAIAIGRMSGTIAAGIYCQSKWQWFQFSSTSTSLGGKS
jgi:hypothetical protein